MMRNSSRARGAPIRRAGWAAIVIAAVLAALAGAAPPLAAQGRGGDESVYLNFPNADLETVVRAIGQLTGRTFVIDPRVKGTLNLVTERPVDKQQAYEQLLAALRLSGFTIVDGGQPGGVVRILPEADAKLQGSRVIAPDARPPAGDQIITQVFRLQNESATSLVQVLRPLIAPNNTIGAVAGSNSLIITDYADNLRRIARIIETLDPASSVDSDVVSLKHGLALEIAATVNRLMEDGARGAAPGEAGQRVTVLAEPRTNVLIVRGASAARTRAALALIERLDRPEATPGNINVVYLRNAEAVKLAPLLRAVLVNDPSFVPQTGGGGLSASSSTSLTSGGSSSLGSTGLSGSSQGAAASTAAASTAAPAAATGTGATGASGGALAGMIQADASTNSLIITAPEPIYRNIRAIIEKLDARRAQVLIESLIVEVNLDKAAELGIQFQGLTGFNSDSAGVIGGTNFNSTAYPGGSNIIGAATNLGTLGPGLNIGVVKGRVEIPGIGTITNLGFLARALETTTHANILSRPNIQTLDNEEAKFLVGQNVPFVTGSYTQTNTGTTNPFQTYERKDVGLELRVKPQISESGTVKMAVSLEVSSIVPGSASAGYITNKRLFESNLLVEDGDFIVLSGLIEDSTNVSVSKVPLLGDIPFIGALFRYENRDRKRTNTMVFLRPTIMRNATASTALAADRYDYMQTQVARANTPDTPVFRGYQIDPALMGRDHPAADAANTTATPAPPATSPAAAPMPARGAGVRLIQLNGITDLARAREVVRDLRDAGYDAYWEPAGAGQAGAVRVRLAVDPARQELASVLAALAARGLEPALARQDP